MSKICSRLIAGLVAAGLSCPALAAPPLTGNILGKQAFHGPGSRGFLPSCSSPFSVTNLATFSNTFTSWTVAAASGITAPVVTSGVSDPNGGTTASQVVFSTVTGAAKFGVIDLPGVTGLGPIPNIFSVWAKVPLVGGLPQTNGTIWATMSLSTTFARTAIPNDGKWHKINVVVPVALFTSGATEAPQIGINLNDGGQTASTGSITVDLWQASIFENPVGPVVPTSAVVGPLATTGSIVTATINIPCPPGVAMRDFRPAAPQTGLSPVVRNPIITENTSNLYESGGVSNPYVTGTPMFFNGFYWGFANATNNLGHANWMSFGLWKSRDGLNWTEDTTNAPYLQTFGSVFVVPAVNAAGTGFGTSLSGTLTWAGTGCPTPLVLNATSNSGGGIASATYASGSCTTWPAGTTWTAGGGLSAGSGASFTFTQTKGTGLASFWQLHPAWLPFGCTISGTHHKFCILYGNEETTVAFDTYIAWSDTINGVYTPAGCTGPGTCASPTPFIPKTPPTSTPTPGGTLQPTNQNLPTVVNVGGVNGTNYIITGGGSDGSGASGGLGPSILHVWSSPAVPTGAQPLWVGIALPGALSTSWDAGTNSIDPEIYLNKCGFYELFYTVLKASGLLGTAKQQIIGYAVSNSPLGPWWKYNGGPIVPLTTTMFFGTNDIGDASPIVVNGRFIWLGNYDNGTNQSRAVAAVMQDACSY